MLPRRSVAGLVTLALGVVFVPSCSRSLHGGIWVAPGPTPAAAPAEPDTPAQAGARKLLAGLGLSEPVGEEQFVAFLARLDGVDEDILRQAIEALARLIPAWDFVPPRDKRLARWDLPPSLGRKLFDLARPYYRRRRWMENDGDDYAIMLTLTGILARMQYEPALDELMKPDAGAGFAGRTVLWWQEWGRAAFRPLLDRSRTARDSWLREQAREMLSRIRDPAAIPDFQELMNSADTAERTAAVRALVEMGAPVDLRREQRLLRDPRASNPERWGAITLLAQGGGENELQQVRDLLKSAAEDPRDQSDELETEARRAIEGLLDRRDPESIAWMLEFVQRRALTEHGRKTRTDVAELLLRRKIAPAVPVLFAILHDSSDVGSIRDAIKRGLDQFYYSPNTSLNDPFGDRYLQAQSQLDDVWRERARERRWQAGGWNEEATEEDLARRLGERGFRPLPEVLRRYVEEVLNQQAAPRPPEALRVARQAIRILVRGGSRTPEEGRAGREWLLALFRRRDLDPEAVRELRVPAIAAVAESYWREPLEALKQIAEDPAEDPVVRQTAARAVSHIDGSEAAFEKQIEAERKAREKIVAPP
ncbi:MAG: HEAT repeat domain-containing protein [Planctomycetes bacterium]|nr:HEAT repeat domain-containing protein [Planctomycetota bacterium]